MSQQEAAGFDWSVWTLSVTDSNGRVLLTLPLEAIVGETSPLQ